MRSLARVLFGRGRSARTMRDSIGTAEAPSALSRGDHQVEPGERFSDFATMRDDPPSTGAVGRSVG